MRGKMLFQNHLVNESHISRPVVFGQRRRESDFEGEVVMRPGQIFEVIGVEDFLAGSRSIPIADFAGCIFCLEKVREMRTKRSHSRTAADVDHFALRRLDMKVAEWKNRGHSVARLQVEDITGAYSGRAVLARRR